MTDRNAPVTKGAANDRELTRLMAGLPGMVYRASAQPPFAFEIVGGGYERILGRSLDELTTKPDIRSTLMYPDDVARYRAAVENAVKRGDTFQIEYSVSYPDTTERVVWEQGGPVRAPDGYFFIEGSIIDIEGPVHARQVQNATYRISQVAASAESLQELYGRIHHIIAELMPSENLYFALRDPQTGFITYPYYIDECDVVPPDPQTAETGVTAYILRTGAPLLLSEFSEAEPIKSGNIAPTGTPAISWLGVPLQLKGSTIGVMAVQVYHGSYRYTEQDRNILSFVADQVAVSIDRWRSRDALAMSEERFRIAAQSTSDIVYEWDIAEDRTTYYGDVDGEFGRAIGGFPSKGSQWDSYIHPDDLPVLKEAIQQNLKVHTPLRIAYRMHCTDGTWRTIVESSQAVLDKDGHVVKWVGTTADITERLHLEHELQRMDKLESLGVLAGGIAHDFNNMLTGIIGNINLARIEDDTGRSSELLQEAEQEILQARGLSQQLLTFAKGGAPVRSVQDLAPVLREAVSFALHGSDVSASFDLPADLWWAGIDKGQLSQVFSNIVINADEAMPARGTISVVARNITVDDGTYPDLAPGDYVRIDLSDTGVGIAETDLRKIFDPFFSTKRRGSGLGLATSYAIVHKHDGTIGVVSTPGAGTTFSILLPAVPAGPSLRSPETAPRFSGHGRVLVMDDEPTVRQVAVAMLKKLGYEAEAVPDGASALRADAEARTAERPFSVILMDLTIPGGMGGQEAAALLRENRTPAQLIASSGYATDPVMAHYREYHFDGVLAKPYSFAELTSVLASLATQRSS
jgi:signal transduction histidine kinase/CheY-like chemotaxis protein/GAF domain-containing protein